MGENTHDNLNWISVENKLPERLIGDSGFTSDVTEDVLVYDYCYGFSMAYYDYIEKKWFRIYEGPTLRDVTHWVRVTEPTGK